jgi:predicted lipid-binding transport protein (Tim44 family)
MNSKFLAFFLALAIGFASMSAEAARRMGSGKSFGKQSNNVTQNQAAKPAPSATPPAAANTAASQPKRPWGAMLGGLAAGLGLAWLASSLGFGEELAQFMMFGLVALVIMMAIGYFMRKKSAASTSSGHPQNLAFQTAGASAPPAFQNTRFQSHNQPSSTASGLIGSALVGGTPSTWSIPAGFDVNGFVSQAKQNFVRMQAAWDRSDTKSLGELMTDDMLVEIKAQMAERDAHAFGASYPTEVVSLDAKLLGIEESADDYLASIEFTGSIREAVGAEPQAFQEVWNMTRSKHDNSGWLVAGIQS